MTQKQLDIFNRKIDVLFDKQRGMNERELAARYKVSPNMIRAYIKLAKNNWKILEAVEMRIKDGKNKEAKNYT